MALVSRHEPKAAAHFMALLVCAGLIAVLASAEARGQDAALNIPDGFKNSVGIGGGAGFSYNSDSPNITVSADYGRAIVGPWGIALAIGWDKTFTKRDGKRTQAQSIDLSAGITYEITERIGLAAGFSRGLFGKERGEGWKTAGSGDWGVGAAISYAFPINDSVIVGPGLAMAYDIGDSEWRSEIDINVSAAF